MNKILLVSSDFEMVRSMTKHLMFQGYSVTNACDSHLAEKLMRKTEFDLLIIDTVLPEENGVLFHKKLRELGYASPILMVGEGAMDEFLLTDLDAGKYDFFLKPLKPDELLDKVNFFCKKYLSPLPVFKPFQYATV